MRRRFPAVLACLFFAAVLTPTGVGLAVDGPSLVMGTSASVSGSSVLKVPTGTVTAGRRWN